MAERGHFLSFGKEPHRCDLPGVFMRAWFHVRQGAKWQCGTCGRIWEWTYSKYDQYCDWHLAANRYD